MLVDNTITAGNFNKPSRKIRLKAIVKFSATDTLDVTIDNYMISCTILEEVSNISGGNPIGDPSADEINLTLLNQGGLFTPTNVNSPYYGKMNLGIAIDLQFTEGNSNVWLPFRTYYICNWVASSNNITVKVTARSKLQNYIKLPMPAIPLYFNITYKRAYEILFTSVGLTSADFEISDKLTQTIDIFYLKSLTWGENLKKLAEASATYCFVDRYNKIIVVPAMEKTLPVAIVSQDNIVITVDQEQKIIHSYGNVAVNFYSMFLKSGQKVLSESSVKLLAANSPITIQFNTSNALAYIESINLTKASDAYIEVAEGASWIVSLKIRTAVDVTTDLEIKGTVVNSNSTTVTISLSNESDSTMSIDNYLIQNSIYANSLATALQNLLTCDILSYNITSRGNPLLEINDVITVDSSVYHINGDAKIVQASYSYNGQLSCSYKLLNVAALEV